MTPVAPNTAVPLAPFNLENQVRALPSQFTPPADIAGIGEVGLFQNGPTFPHPHFGGQFGVGLDGVFIGGNDAFYRPRPGALVDIFAIPPVLPQTMTFGRDFGDKLLLNLNGVTVPAETADLNTARWANIAGLRALSIYNEPTAGGQLLPQSGELLHGKAVFDDWSNPQANPSIVTTANALYSAYRAGRLDDLVLTAHSNGAAVTREALEMFTARLQRDGVHNIQGTLQQLTVVTTGAGSSNFPEGPRYLHLLNIHDSTAGRNSVTNVHLTRNFGANATVLLFADPTRASGNGDLGHSFARYHEVLKHVIDQNLDGFLDRHPPGFYAVGIDGRAERYDVIPLKLEREGALTLIYRTEDGSKPFKGGATDQLLQETRPNSANWWETLRLPEHPPKAS